ncbi:MAG: excinuclease ABC subunit UvrC [Armatimonadetes bacterium]|nr:excinuclease ABC subunit UvrC [Armatimonadota bacterium]
MPDGLTEKLGQLPTTPGCYIYRDEAGGILYIGKAVNLRSRVRSYFRESTRHGTRIERMVLKIHDLEWMMVDTELEALVLECNLIKRHRPPYNVRMRDDKSYPYVVITGEKFPRVLFTRNPRRGFGKYFGPYTSAWAVRDTLQLLHKVYPLIPCGKSWSGREEQRPCLYYHLGQCLAPCAGLADPEEYKKVVSDVERFLNGKQDDLIDQQKLEMTAAAEEEDFELAAKIRDRIAAIETVRERQKVLSNDDMDRDVIAVVRDERGSSVQMLYVRGGKLIGQRNFILDGSQEASPGEAVQEFVKQYYSEAPEIPKEILLPVEIEEKMIVQQWLRTKRGSAMTVEVPQGGERLNLVEMAARSAEQALETHRLEIENKESWAEEAMSQLADSLGLPSPPLRIEGYDISNIQGTAPVSSMVVTENGEPAKAEYRKFAIKFNPETPNDFAMMHETLSRRLRRYLDGDPKFSKLPDLIMIDGGKGQLHAALKARDAMKLTVPMVGLAKKMELIMVPILVGEKNGEFEYEYETVELPMNSPGLMLLRKLRDEAHRFALSFHRKVRAKRMTGSALDEITGVGPRRRRILLRTFGSLDGIKRAAVAELASVPTMTLGLANRIHEILNDE